MVELKENFLENKFLMEHIIISPLQEKQTPTAASPNIILIILHHSQIHTVAKVSLSNSMSYFTQDISSSAYEILARLRIFLKEKKYTEENYIFFTSENRLSDQFGNLCQAKPPVAFSSVLLQRDKIVRS